jgi:hypothetical protein
MPPVQPTSQERHHQEFGLAVLGRGAGVACADGGGCTLLRSTRVLRSQPAVLQPLRTPGASTHAESHRRLGRGLREAWDVRL